MRPVPAGAAYKWLLVVAVCVALACLTWWLAAGRTQGAEVAGALGAVSSLVAALAALGPLLRWLRSDHRPVLSEVHGYSINAAAVERLKSAPRSETGRIMHSRKIGLWGPPASGKTCYLSALDTARVQAIPPWILLGTSPADQEYLSRLTASMVRQREFPNPTAGIDRLDWVLSTEIELPRRGGRHQQLEARLALSILDVPGWLYSSRKLTRGTELTEHLVDELASCDGLIFFFDSTRERDHPGEAYEHFHDVAGRLARKLMLSGELINTRLPHYIAVCVAKYDETSVLRFAKESGYLTEYPDDPYRFPRVADSHAEDLFKDLCVRSSHESDGSTSILSAAIEGYFHPDRTRYFAVSSIGFYLNQVMRFDPNDCYNIAHPDGHQKLRGDIHPINVLEPLLWLGDFSRTS